MVLAAAQGCTSFESEAPPTPPDSSAADATTSPLDATGPDAADAADAAAGPFCERFSVPPRLCADFEDGRAVGAAFPVNLSSGGKVEVADGGFESLFALHATGATPGVVARDFTSPLPKEQSLAFRVRLPLQAAYAKVARLVIRTQANDEACSFELSFSDHLATFGYGATNALSALDLAGNPGNGSWFHVALALKVVSVDGGSGAVQAAVTIDGKNALPAATVPSNCDGSIFAAGRQRIEVGAQSMNFPVDILIDDVVFDGK